MPKRYRITFSPLAKQDLNEIYAYIKEVLEAPLSAEKVVRAIRDKSDTLKILPYGYQKVDEETEIRAVSVRKYRIFYRISEENSIVIILRIIYSRRTPHSL